MDKEWVVRDRDGRLLAPRMSVVFDGAGQWRWTTLEARAHLFATLEEAEVMAAALLEEDPDCGAEAFERRWCDPKVEGQ